MAQMTCCVQKRALLRRFAAVAKVLANERRLGVLELVARGERSVETLAECSGLSIAGASQHLQQLRRAGLVTAQRQAQLLTYRLADDTVLITLELIHKAVERDFGAVERILRSYSDKHDNLVPLLRKELAR